MKCLVLLFRLSLGIIISIPSSDDSIEFVNISGDILK